MGTSKGFESPALIPDVRRDARKTGILPSQEIHELINNRNILSMDAIEAGASAAGVDGFAAGENRVSRAGKFFAEPRGDHQQKD